jgi:hypothetical protein
MTEKRTDNVFTNAMVGLLEEFQGMLEKEEKPVTPFWKEKVTPKEAGRRWLKMKPEQREEGIRDQGLTEIMRLMGAKK